MTAAGRCAAQDQKEAASPPLTFTIGLPHSRPGTRRAKVQGRPSGVKAVCDRWARTALPGKTREDSLDPGDLCDPSGRNTGRPQPAPPRARRVRSPCPGTQTNARERSELAFDTQKKRQITRISYEEPSTV